MPRLRATILPLGVLPEPDAAALFTRVFPHALTADDQQAVAGLVRLCGCLPLAITIVAAGIDPGERTAVADLLTDLESAQDRLAVIDAHLDDQELGVAAAFDLIAVYLRARTAAGERGQALERLLDYYQHAAAAAASGISRYNARPPRATAPGPESATPDLSSQARAITWLRAERANLLACLQHTRRYRQHTRLVDLTASLGIFLDQDDPPAERKDMRAHALSVCREIGDRTGEAWTLSKLGACRNITSYLQATGLQEQALIIFRELGDRDGEAFALLELGDLLIDDGDFPQAADLLEQALTIRREIGNRDGEAEILNHQGALLCTCGDPAKARERHLRALELARGAGNPLEEARALAGTGRCAMAMRIADGPADLRKALEIFRRIGAAEAVDLTAADDLHPSHTASGWTLAEN